MRVTKEPEVRKQEILDTALKLFGENGYEKTSITDIAKAIGVAQGLCYRYFPSKEALFDSAIEQYADVLVEQFVGAEKDNHKTLRQIIEDMPRSEEHTSELQSRFDLVCRLLLEKKKLPPTTAGRPITAPTSFSLRAI